jgi:hypothetical protein
VLSMLLLVLGAAVVVIAGTQLYGLLFSAMPQRSWSLAHGRDVLMLICLFLLFGCIALISGWRLYLWRWRCLGHLGSRAGVAGVKASALPPRRQGQVAQSAVAAGIAALLVGVGYHGLPNAVDAMWPAILIDSLLLLLGILFLAALWSESRRLAWLAQVLAPTADLPAEPPAAGPDRSAASPPGGSWASPLQLNALPQSPFSLHFREPDLAALLAYSDETWRDQTRALLERKWPFEPGSALDFRAWQARLVAEMRYGTTAIRSCAWSAILAPTTILLAMGLYPPFNERLMTTASVVLVFVAFAFAMYVVIKLEQHPLLGPMFTQNGDRLSIGGAVGALWGKLIAAAVILVPVLFPDALSGLYGLLQSIDSLH